jgi:oligoribonuclease NrnB/cAMP/cGMP phosphodiesterase (DHH superfamily)
MKTTVVYHSADFDGLFCREIARKFLPDAELIGWDFSDAPIKFPNDGQVYVLDLSPDVFDREASLIENARHIWIDHHKSSIEKWSPQIPGYRIDGVSACRLAWQWFTGFSNTFGNDKPQKADYFNRRVTEPLAVRLAGEYDIWDKRDPRAELLQHGLRSRELDSSWWSHLLEIPSPENQQGENTIASLLDAGSVIQYAKTKENESIIKHMGFTIQFEGLTFLACNHARYNSFLFTAGLKPEHDACFGFKYSKGQWEVSLYHAPGKEHHDLSQIAVKYGGGGHRGACGFRILKLPFAV